MSDRKAHLSEEWMASAASAASLSPLPVTEPSLSDLQRRLTYLMAFRVLLITLVLGATTVLYWLSDVDLGKPNSLILYGIIAATYLLTLLYAKELSNSKGHSKLANQQVVADLIIASVIVHITGGVQSAYTFFYPLAIIGSAVVQDRRGAMLVTFAAVFLFLLISYLGWIGVIPTPVGQIYLPSAPSTFVFGRAIALNLAAIIGVGAMAVQLAAQLQRSSADLEVHRSVTANLLTIHENIVRGLTSGLITVDSHLQILTMNDAAVSILGLQEPQVGSDLANCAPQLCELLQQSPAEEEARRGEITHHASDANPRILGVSISPLFDHQPVAIGRIINFQDLTEVRALEEKMKRGERLAVIGTLAAGIAHEIRNPLASISGSVELLGSGPAIDEDSTALMNIVSREIERLDALITDLLAYANPRPSKKIPLDLAVLLEDTLRVFAQDTEFKTVVTIFERGPEADLLVCADPEQIRQIVWNLLRNGAEAASEGGQHLWLTTLLLDNEVVLRVKDDGLGMPAELQSKVFDPFFTTKAKGTGLGLSMVHSTVVEHGGSIRIDSEVNEGTTFELRLPYHCPHDR